MRIATDIGGTFTDLVYLDKKQGTVGVTKASSNTVYSRTVFANKPLRSTQVILLLRGICKGESTACLARELQLAYDTIHHLRQQIQTNAIHLQPDTPLSDAVTETDEMFHAKRAGEKGEKHSDPADPPRCRANQQKGHGTYLCQ